MNNLKHIRENAGLTQEELGKLLGCTFVTVSRYESQDQRLTLPLMRKMCKVLGCNISELVGEENSGTQDTIRDEVLKRALRVGIEFISENKVKGDPQKISNFLYLMYEWFLKKSLKDGKVANDNEMVTWLQGSFSIWKEQSNK